MEICFFKPGMFGLGLAPKEIFFAYSIQFVFLTISLYLETWSWSPLICVGKVSIMGEWISGTTWKHVYFNISVLFIVNTTFILKLVFPTSYCFCLDDRLGGYVVATIVPVFIVAFTYFFIYLVYLFIYYIFCRFDRYSYLCCRCCHRYCCFCCWCYRFLLSVCVWLLLLLN